MKKTITVMARFVPCTKLVSATKVGTPNFPDFKSVQEIGIAFLWPAIVDPGIAMVCSIHFLKKS